VNRIREETKLRLSEKFNLIQKDAELQSMMCNTPKNMKFKDQ